MRDVFTHIAGERIASLMPSGAMRWTMIVLAAASTIAAIAFGIAGNLPWGLILLPAALLFGTAAFVLGQPRGSFKVGAVDHAGAARPAFVVAMSRRKVLVGAVVAAVLAAACAAAAVVLWGESVVASRGISVPGPVAAAIAGAFAVLLGAMAFFGFAKAIRGGYLAVMRDGILMYSGTASTFVPWSLVTGVSVGELRQYGRYRFVAVRYADEPGTRRSALANIGRWANALMWLRSPGNELQVGEAQTGVSAAEMFAVIAYFHANPELRGRIGSPGSLSETMSELRSVLPG